MSYTEYDLTEQAKFKRLNEIVELSTKTDLESQIAYMEIYSEFVPIAGAILKSLKKLQSLQPSDSEKIVKEIDTCDDSQDIHRPAQCTGKCQIMGVGLSQCSTCGWDETHSLRK